MHIYMTKPQRIACSLWVILTYCYDAFRILPMLGVTSPTKRCGKSTLAEVLEAIVYKGIPASSLTPAVTFRLIEQYQPCLIADEMDTYIVDNPDLRGVFNAGHTHRLAFVWRSAPFTHEPEKFSVWGPKVLLMIGNLPPTLDDRVISIPLQRKPVKEKFVEPILDLIDIVGPIRSKCYKWCKDNFDDLKKVKPKANLSSDRAMDNWHPLLAIAELIGGDAPKKAKSAMLTIEGGADSDSDEGSLLLKDVRDIFNDSDVEKMHSDELVEELNRLEERPWPYLAYKGITQYELAKRLKPFGIISVQIKIDKVNKRGYNFFAIKRAHKQYK